MSETTHPEPKRDEENRQHWERLLAYGEERFRAKLPTEGLDPDTMTEEEKMDYVERVIHEHREERRARDRPD